MLPINGTGSKWKSPMGSQAAKVGDICSNLSPYFQSKGYYVLLYVFVSPHFLFLGDKCQQNRKSEEIIPEETPSDRGSNPSPYYPKLKQMFCVCFKFKVNRDYLCRQAIVYNTHYMTILLIFNNPTTNV